MSYGLFTSGERLSVSDPAIANPDYQAMGQPRHATASEAVHDLLFGDKLGQMVLRGVAGVARRIVGVKDRYIERRHYEGRHNVPVVAAQSAVEATVAVAAEPVTVSEVIEVADPWGDMDALDAMFEYPTGEYVLAQDDTQPALV
jgi:hypothetical protein